MKKFFFAATLLALTSAALAQAPNQQAKGSQAQNQEEPAAPLREGIIGKVAAVSKDFVTVSPMNGDKPVTVKIGSQTRIFKGRDPIQLSDLQVEQTVMVRGTMSGDALQGRTIRVIPAEMAQRMAQQMQQGGPAAPGGRGPGGRGPFNPEDMGKKFIAGEVKSIQETKLTIARPDNQTQEIEVDETTSFKRGGESITLADIKPGDFVRGAGELKNGVFVPKELMVGGRPRMRMDEPGAPKN